MKRRQFLSTIALTQVVALAGATLMKAAQFPNPRPDQVPGPPGQPAPTNNNQANSQLPGQTPSSRWPDDPSDDLAGPKLDPKAVLKEDQKQMVKDVNQIYDLASKLRKQVHKTDSSEVLSMDLIHTAEQIEKLARHVRDLARG